MADRRDETKARTEADPGPGNDPAALDRDQPAEPWPPAVLEEDEAGCE
jgi:hypothetical protein